MSVVIQQWQVERPWFQVKALSDFIENPMFVLPAAAAMEESSLVFPKKIRNPKTGFLICACRRWESNPQGITTTRT